MIKLAGMAAYTTCVDLGSLVWSEAYLPSPSVYECGGPIGRFLCQHLAMQLKRRERNAKKQDLMQEVTCTKTNCKELNKTYWDGYHKYHDRIKEWGSGRELVGRGDMSLEEFILQPQL